MTMENRKKGGKFKKTVTIPLVIILANVLWWLINLIHMGEKKEPQLNICPHEIGMQVCRWRIFLKLIDVGRTSLLWMYHP